MKTLKIFSLLSLIAFVSASNYYKGEGPKPKKIYKDTIYRWKVKPVRTVKTEVTVKPESAIKPEIAEENRLLRITSTILRIKVRKSAQKLYAYFNDTFKVFRIAIGTNPVGPK